MQPVKWHSAGWHLNGCCADGGDRQESAVPMPECASPLEVSEIPRQTAREIVYALTGLAVPPRFPRTESDRPCLTVRELERMLRDPDVPEVLADLCRVGLVEECRRGRYTASVAAAVLVELTGYVV